MKKKLEAELMSIAHRVLQMKNKSDINQLCIETQRLYEKLAVLRFVEEHFGGAKPTIGQAEVVEKMNQLFEEKHLTEVQPTITKLEISADNVVEEEIIKEQIIAEEVVEKENNEDEIAKEESTPLTEAEFNEAEPDQEGEETNEFESAKSDNIVFIPAFELDVEEALVTPKKVESIQISFEDLLGTDYKETQFVKVDDNKANPLDFELPKVTTNLKESEDYIVKIQESKFEIESEGIAKIEKQASGIPIGLNDRIAFVKHLFGNSDEDYNRVMNQLITYDNFDEAQIFIEDMVKPDYSDWQGKEDYEQRFLEIIEKKFA